MLAEICLENDNVENKKLIAQISYKILDVDYN